MHNPSIEHCTISDIHLNIPGVTSVYKGKVRNVYHMDKDIIVVATDRISAFDHILSRPVPYKGQVLNQIAAYFLEASSDIVPNWYKGSPDPNVSIGIKADPIKIEMVVRGYLAGHAWRTYKSGNRILCGVNLPDGLKENVAFESPIITPTTKASEGHDMDISVEDIIKQGILTSDVWETLEKYARLLFDKGTQMAAERGLILVDTKYEFGVADGQILLIDEIHTPDSSRYFFKDGYEERQKSGEHQPQLSKEFVREWLISKGFQGLEGQIMPFLPDDFVWEISERYIQLYELITGKTFIKADTQNIKTRIEENIKQFFNQSI